MKESRTCQVCENLENEVENENHFLFHCVKYRNERAVWLQKLDLPPNFYNLTQIEKLDLVLSHPNNVKCTAQFVIIAFDIRSKTLNRL